MKKHILPLVIAAAALLLGGCLPEEFIWWSPDGQTAAVRTSDGLRLTGTNGQLSAVILPGEIQSASWLPDGSGLIVSRSFELTNWAAAEKMIPRGEAAATMQMARAIPDLLKAGLTASGGSWDNLEEKFLKPLGMTESQVLERPCPARSACTANRSWLPSPASQTPPRWRPNFTPPRPTAYPFTRSLSSPCATTVLRATQALIRSLRRFWILSCRSATRSWLPNR